MWTRTAFLTCLVALALGLVILQTSPIYPQPPPEGEESPGRRLPPRAALEPDPYQPPTYDLCGDLLPGHAIARFGSVRFHHPSEIASVAFAPDGKMVASTAGITSFVRVCDTATGREVERFRGKIRADAVSFSADGRALLVVRCGDYGFEEWNVTTAQRRREVKHNARPFFPHAVHFSADRKLIVLTDRMYHFSLWEVDSGQQRYQVEVPNTKGALPLAFSPDGKVIATHSDDGVFRLWDAVTGKEFSRFQGEEDWGSPLGFSPDSKTVATLKGSALCLWDVQNRKQIMRLAGGTAPLAFSPDGKSLAFDLGGAICLYDLAQKRELSCFEGHKSWRWSNGGNLLLAFSPDGKVLASGGDDHLLILWDLTTGKPRQPFDGQRGAVISLTFAPDGRSIAAGGKEDGTLLVWDLATSQVRSRSAKHRQGVLAAAYSPDGKLIATGDGYHQAGGKSMPIRLWDAADGRLVREFEAHQSGVYCLAFSPDGKVLASGGGDDTARVWETATGKELQHFVVDRRSDQIQTLALSPDGKTLVLGSQKGEFLLCDVQQNKPLGGLFSHQRLVHLARFAPDGRTLVTLGHNPERTLTAEVWDVQTWKVVQRVELFESNAADAGFAISPDTKTLAVRTRDHSVSVWDLKAGKERFRFWGHTGPVAALAFSPDGRLLASGSEDTTVLVWDLVRARLADLWWKLGSATDTDPLRATWELEDTPADSISYLKERLTWHATQEAHVRKLLALLDDDKFEVRAKAAAELRSLGQAAGLALECAQEGELSAEVRRQVGNLLEGLTPQPPAPPPDPGSKRRRVQELQPPPPPKEVPAPERASTRERRAIVRAFAVLEEINTPAARGVVQALAKSDAKGWLTRQAELAWQRLRRRASKAP
jgi:WD40 repeat protein